MPLTTMKPLLAWAEENRRAVAAFSVCNMETTMGVLAAAEQSRLPIILQIAEKRLSHAPLQLIAPMLLAAAAQAAVPVAVHFDHGVSLEGIDTALQQGFTSVMFDGSRMALADNIANTLAVKKLAASSHATVEAELGILGGSETGEATLDIQCTSPDDAEAFCLQTGVDALAVAIGNAHGNYSAAPRLRFDVLEEIARRVQTPLVLHGGTGLSVQDFQTAIRLGVRKINIATSTFESFILASRTHLEANPQNDYFAWNRAVVAAIQENALRHLAIFCAG